MQHRPEIRFLHPRDVEFVLRTIWDWEKGEGRRIITPDRALVRQWAKEGLAAIDIQILGHYRNLI